MATGVRGEGLQEIRRDFPLLSRYVNGKPLAYLDNAATTQKPRQVLEVYLHYYESYNANVHRAIHTLGEEATEAYESARAKLASFIGCRGPEEIVFVRGATEAINLVARAWGDSNLARGDNIVLTIMEHHSNIVPWQLLARRVGCELRYADITEDGLLNMDHLSSLIDRRTKLVAVSHASNVLGTINPIPEISKMAHEVGALLLVDAAQSVPHMPLNVRELGCDFLALSGHKMLAPTGSGALYAKRHLLESMEPFMGGGEMIREVFLDRSTWNDVPWKFEAGTPNIGGSIALGAAVDYLNAVGMQRVREHDKRLTKLGLELLGEIPQLRMYGPSDPERKCGIIAFTLDKVHPHDIAAVLDREGVAIRSGHHCTMPLHRRLNIPASARASFYIYNTEEEVQRLAEGVKKAKQLLG